MRTTVHKIGGTFVATCYFEGEPLVFIERPTREAAIAAARHQARLRRVQRHEILDHSGAPATEGSRITFAAP